MSTGAVAKGKPPKDDPPPPEVPSCAVKDSDFPAFAYTVQITNRKGIVGWDFYLSNADADCEVKIHTSDYRGNDLEFSYSQNGNDGVIVWRQDNNEYAGRRDVDAQFDRIKMISFETGGEKGKEVVTSLPVQSTTVAVTTADHNSFRYIDLSEDGNTIVTSMGNNDAGGETINSINEIDISNCSSNCGPSAPLYSHDEFAFVGLSYSTFGDRIYFTSAFRSSSTSPLAGQHYLAFIEKSGVAWTSPRFLSISNNGFYEDFGGADSGYWRQPDVAIADIGDDATEVVAFGLMDRPNDMIVVQIIDVGNCASEAEGFDDCLTSGESTIIENISNGMRVSFDNKIDATGVYITSQTRDIIKHDFIGANAILGHGEQADSAH